MYNDTQRDTKQDNLKNFLERFQQMDSSRSDREKEWKYTDLQVRAEVSTDKRGRLLVNVPIERVLLDINDGKYAQPVPYDVIWSQWYNDPQAIQPVYFALQDFLDREEFYNEKKAAIRDRAQYGTMHMFTGIRQNSYMRYEPRQVMEGIYSDDMKQLKRTEYKYCPVNIPIYNIWRDDQAMNQWNYKKADDCIYEEAMSIERIKETFSLLDDFDVEEVKPYPIDNPAYNKQNDYPNQWLISYYYNKVTSDRQIILNHNYIIHEGKYYHDGHLPVTSAQHFQNNDSIYGEGKPHRIRAMKWYKKSILQDILDASKMNAGINLLVTDGTEVNWQVGSWINIWSTTWSWANAIQPVQMQTKIAEMVAVVNVVDDLINIDAWENVRAPYSSPKTTLWEIEIMEEKQQLRDRALDQNLNVFMDDVLTKSAKNLTKYMVVQEKESKDLEITTTDDDGKETTETITHEIYPKPVINVRWFKVEELESKKKEGESEETEEKGKYIPKYRFTKDLSEEWFFTLDESMCKWEFLVKIVTTSTKPSNAIAKNTFLQATESLDQIANTFRLLWIPIAEDFKQSIQPKDILEKRKQLYEMTNIEIAKTDKWRTEEEIKELTNISRMMMWWMGAGDPAAALNTDQNIDANNQRPTEKGTFEATPQDRAAPVT